MATSSRYTELTNRISQIEAHLLPPEKTTGYTDQDQDLIRAYCLLCHAEIEAYFEDIVISAADEAIATWTKDKTVVTPIIFHLAYTLKMSPEKGKDFPPYQMVHLAYVNLKKLVDSNNGIKENNIQPLFKPLGYELEPILQTSLNDLGKKRGQIAHTSFKTHTVLDPKTEKKNLAQILNEMAVFDLDLATYKTKGLSSKVPFNMRLGELSFSFKERIRILFTGKL